MNLSRPSSVHLIKKHSVSIEDLSSYRPISNLNFITKIFERIIRNRLNRHLTSFPSLSPFQSAYRKFHSAETALLRIYNDLLVSISQHKLSALVLLDLSAVFDTIDHNILLSRLTSNFGISGSALSLISSYLSNRSQSVSVQSHLSFCSHLHWRPSGFSPWSSSLLSIYYASLLPFLKLPCFVSPLC